MKFDNFSLRHQAVLSYLAHVPSKLLAYYDHDALAELVLCDLSGGHCFNFAKAAYLVNNPDFNCLKGVAGIAVYPEVAQGNVWEHPDAASDRMRHCQFNKKVRTVFKASLPQEYEQRESSLQNLSRELGFVRPSSCTWPLKHGNTGVLLFERPESDDIDQHLATGLSLLGFCHIR